MQGRPLFDEIHRTQYAENKIIKLMLESFYSKQMPESHYLLCLLPVDRTDIWAGMVADKFNYYFHNL